MKYRLNSWSEKTSETTLTIISLYYETDDKLFYIEGRKQVFLAEDLACIEFGTQHILFAEKTDSFDRAFFTWWRAVTRHPAYRRNFIKAVEHKKARNKLPAVHLYFL